VTKTLLSYISSLSVDLLKTTKKALHHCVLGRMVPSVIDSIHFYAAEPCCT